VMSSSPLNWVEARVAALRVSPFSKISASRTVEQQQQQQQQQRAVSVDRGAVVCYVLCSPCMPHRR
jgi:hypothetical protein